MNVTSMERLLLEFPDLQYRIKEFQDKLNTALLLKQNSMDTLKAYKYGCRIKNTQTANPTLEAVQRSIDIHGESIKYYEQTIKEYNRRLLAMEETLKVLAPHERKIIDLRYWKRHEWKSIAQRIHYCIRQCIYIRNDAIDKIIEKYDSAAT